MVAVFLCGWEVFSMYTIAFSGQKYGLSITHLRDWQIDNYLVYKEFPDETWSDHILKYHVIL